MERHTRRCVYVGFVLDPDKGLSMSLFNFEDLKLFHIALSEPLIIMKVKTQKNNIKSEYAKFLHHYLIEFIISI